MRIVTKTVTNSLGEGARSMKAIVAGLVVVAALAGCSSSTKTSSGSTATTKAKGGTKSNQASGSKDAASEVKITSCKKDPTTAWTTISGTADNTTSKRSDFSIELAITSADGKTQIDTPAAFVQNLEPGQTAKWDAPSTKDFVTGEKCKVSTVSRSASA